MSANYNESSKIIALKLFLIIISVGKESGVAVSKSATFGLLHILEFQARVPKVKPKINIKQRCVRLLWCKQKFFWGQQDWEIVLFCNESLFQISVDKGSVLHLAF